MKSNKAGNRRARTPLASHQEDGISNGTGPTSLQQLSKWRLPTGIKQQPHKQKIVGFRYLIGAGYCSCKHHLKQVCQ